MIRKGCGDVRRGGGSDKGMDESDAIQLSAQKGYSDELSAVRSTRRSSRGMVVERPLTRVVDSVMQ